VNFALADELVAGLCEERAAIERAAAEGVPLMRSLLDPRTGRRYDARRRAVSNGSIRKSLDAAERVLRDARKRGALAGEVPALKSAAPKGDRPCRSFLEAEQIVAVIRAADMIEAEHGSSGRSVSERAAGRGPAADRAHNAAYAAPYLRVDPRYMRRTAGRAMYLMGQADPTLTLAVYRQVLDTGKGSVELLEQTVGCTLAAARAIYNGEATAAETLERELGSAPAGISSARSRGRRSNNGCAERQVSGTNPKPAEENTPSTGSESATRHKKPAR